MTEEGFSPVDHLLLNNPESWNPNEVAEALMDDDAVIEWKPEEYWKRTVLRRDKKRLEEVLANHLKSFQKYREEENFERFKYAIMQGIPELSLSEQEAAQYDDQLVKVYEFWRDFYLYMGFSTDDDPTQSVRSVSSDLWGIDFFDVPDLLRKSSYLRRLSVQEAVNKVGTENWIAAISVDRDLINISWNISPDKFVEDFIKGFQLIGLIRRGTEKDIEPERLSFIADSFRRFVYVHKQNFQRSEGVSVYRNFKSGGVEALKELLEYKNFANSLFSKVNDLDPSLVRNFVNMEGDSVFRPDGPDVLAAWIDFYAMMKYSSEEPNVNGESPESWSTKLMIELSGAGVLSREKSYWEKITIVKMLIWRMVNGSS